MTEPCQSCDRLDDLLAEATAHIAALETASRALAAKLEECEVHISRAFAFFDNHRQPYKRPHYRDELDALIAVLKSKEGEG